MKLFQIELVPTVRHLRNPVRINIVVIAIDAFCPPVYLELRS